MTEKELASAVKVPARTIANILAGKLPHDAVIWERFARYFRLDADFLRTGGPPYAGGIFDLTKTWRSSPKAMRSCSWWMMKAK